ncbi:heparinase II/III family protein [Propylenella binzhouense]|uniref:Heparinase n=1 Tax=Propylenella binzhouense TaxID=2555902 RepID=A0A964T6F5_9HYPH|nr:heparinase II/III family protein [Propylenella binzhouense]MYZ49406.1 heparinase [Propylenella binzhouense]
MTAIAPGDRVRLALHRAGRLGRRIRQGAVAGTVRRWRGGRGGAFELLIAPPDLRTADPTVALDIYGGRFVFAGQVLEAEGQSPFEAVPPSEDWLRELHGFGWLRHLRAADTPLARSNARAILRDWQKLYGKPTLSIPWETDVAARRALSLLAQSPLILSDADHAAYRRFARGLLGHAAFLKSSISTCEPGLSRLKAAIAVAAIGLSFSGQERIARAGLERLDRELEVQILPDGGHVSRNPTALVDVLIDLLPLRQSLIARGQSPSGLLMNAIDRMTPMLRFFRHADGSFAHFNGASAAASSLVPVLLAYDDNLGAPISSAAYSGYERVAVEDMLLLVDTGRPPPIAYSSEAHAGALAFELSCGANRIVINCGAPAARHRELRRASRLTAAHTTAVLEDLSSCRFEGPEANAHIVAGPHSVSVARQTLEDGRVLLDLDHDGYQRRLGLNHQRRLILTADGTGLHGSDLFPGEPLRPAIHYAIRFHLHPSVRVDAGETPNGIDLVLPGGGRWLFEASAPVTIEESVLLSDVVGAIRTRQLVLRDIVQQNPAVGWRFQRVG